MDHDNDANPTNFLTGGITQHPLANIVYLMILSAVAVIVDVVYVHNSLFLLLAGFFLVLAGIIWVRKQTRHLQGSSNTNMFVGFTEAPYNRFLAVIYGLCAFIPIFLVLFSHASPLLLIVSVVALAMAGLRLCIGNTNARRS